MLLYLKSFFGTTLYTMCNVHAFIFFRVDVGLNVHIAQSMHVRETDIETQDIFADLLRYVLL